MLARLASLVLRSLAALVATIVCVVPAAFADECRSRDWRPTFVRHDSVAPVMFYVEADGSFTRMATPEEAQRVCRERGVREPIGGSDCGTRNWGDFACGCNITPARNAACLRFQSYLRSIGVGPEGAIACRELYERALAETRRADAARRRRDLDEAYIANRNALALVRQGLADIRCLSMQQVLRSTERDVDQNMRGVAAAIASTSPPRATFRGIETRSALDLVGAGESLQGNGRPDAVFRVSLLAPGRVIVGVEVRNTSGQRSIWDTYPGNGMWLGALTVDGRTVSQPTGAVDVPLGESEARLDFYCEDNGSVQRGDTAYVMTIRFRSGGDISIPLRR